MRQRLERGPRSLLVPFAALGLLALVLPGSRIAAAAPGGAAPQPPPAPSTAESPKAAAKRHYDRGTALFALDRYDEAIKEFEAGYLDAPLPAFLYNIGQAHKKAGRPERARSYFERYLEMAPDAADRPEVERLIAEIDDAAKAPPSAPAAPPAAAPGPGPGTTAPAPAPAPAPAVPSDATANADKAAAPAASAPSRGWLWGVIAGAGALVVGGVVVGVVLGPQGDPSTDFGIVEPFK